MPDKRSAMQKLRDRRIEIKELQKYYAEKLIEREVAIIMLDAAISDLERGIE